MNDIIFVMNQVPGSAWKLFVKYGRFNKNNKQGKQIIKEGKKE
jgi:hypothetical protein